MLIGNAIRVALCVVLADNVSNWFASGTVHEILSLVVFSSILLMVVNTDAILNSFLTEHVPWFDDAETRSLGDEAFEPVPVSSATVIKGTKTHALPHASTWLVVFGGVALFGFLAFRISDQAPATIVAIEDPLPALNEGDLPGQIFGESDANAKTNRTWQRMRFEQVDRDVDAMLAKTSYTWVYSNGETSVVVSVDCPWSSWHNLDICYRALGWETEPTYFRPSHPQAPWSELSVTDLAMNRPSGDTVGRVLFTVIDRQRDEVQLKSWRMRGSSLIAFADEFVARTWLILTGGERESSVSLPATTIQVMCEHAGGLTDQQQQSIENFFYEVRRLLLEGRRWESV